MIVVHILVDCRTRWARTSSTPSPRRSPIASPRSPAARVGLRILSNLCDKRCVRVRCRVPAEALATDDDERRGRHRRHRQRLALRRARSVPRRHAQQGDHERHRRRRHRDRQRLARGRGRGARVRGAVGPVLSRSPSGAATGDDLVGRLELPLALGTVGGTLRVHPAARLSLRMLGVTDAQELAAIAAVGRASRRTSPPCARSRPTGSSAATWPCTRARSRSRRAPSASWSSASPR